MQTASTQKLSLKPLARSRTRHSSTLRLMHTSCPLMSTVYWSCSSPHLYASAIYGYMTESRRARNWTRCIGESHRSPLAQSVEPVFLARPGAVHRRVPCCMCLRFWYATMCLRPKFTGSKERNSFAVSTFVINDTSSEIHRALTLRA